MCPISERIGRISPANVGVAIGHMVGVVCIAPKMAARVAGLVASEILLAALSAELSDAPGSNNSAARTYYASRQHPSSPVEL